MLKKVCQETQVCVSQLSAAISRSITFGESERSRADIHVGRVIRNRENEILFVPKGLTFTGILGDDDVAIRKRKFESSSSELH